MINKINEDGEPATTTDNGGNGLILPQLPIKANNLLRRYKLLKDKKLSGTTDNQKLDNIK